MQLRRKARFELVPKTEWSSFAVRDFHLPAFSSPWHFHPECELTYILQSTGQRFVGDSIAPFRPGDLVLIGANLPHVWRNDPQTGSPRPLARSLVVQFREDMFGEAFLASPELERVRKLLVRARRGIQFTGSTPEAVEPLLLKMRAESGLPRVISLLRVFLILEGAKGSRTLSSRGFTPQLDAFAGDRINHAYQYIFKRFAGSIDYQEIARGVGMSLSGFSHYFRRATGRTVSDVVNEVRIGHAHRMLIETDQTVTEVAYACGFGTLSNFNRRFRTATGISPRQYRSRHQG